MSFRGFAPYVPVAQRRAKAAKEMEKLRKKGRAVSPVVIEGRKIATSFWGKAWCDNLERYSDYANRLPRGRTYVNNGSVVDLQIARGTVEALVSGSELYKIRIEIAVAAPPRWRMICADCAGSVGSIVELLQGKLSKHVMERVCRADDGLFPGPREIKLSCSCPDGARMCKHVAAALYGVGSRLDRDPDLLFTLRGVDRSELVSTGADLSITEAAAGSERVLAGDDVAALFGLELETAPAPAAKAPAARRATAKTEQTRSAAAPARAAGGRAKAGQSRSNGGLGSARPPKDAAAKRPTGSAAEATLTLAAGSARRSASDDVSPVRGAGGRAAKPSRKSSASAKASRPVNSDRNGAKPEPAPAPQSRRAPNLEPKDAEKGLGTPAPSVARFRAKAGAATQK